MVIWIIGKSGSGKTFFASRLVKFLKKKKLKIKWLDGDKFRKTYSKDLGYSLNDRIKNSKRVQKVCRDFEIKNYIVVASVQGFIKEHQKKNRTYFQNYIQIYVKTNLKLLMNRNTRKVYSNKKNILGLDIKFPEPYKSHFVINNNFNNNFVLIIKKLSKKIYEQLQQKY